jgi:hypothetical protein
MMHVGVSGKMRRKKEKAYLAPLVAEKQVQFDSALQPTPEVAERDVGDGRRRDFVAVGRLGGKDGTYKAPPSANTRRRNLKKRESTFDDAVTFFRGVKGDPGAIARLLVQVNNNLSGLDGGNSKALEAAFEVVNILTSRDVQGLIQHDCAHFNAPSACFLPGPDPDLYSRWRVLPAEVDVPVTSEIPPGLRSQLRLAGFRVSYDLVYSRGMYT